MKKLLLIFLSIIMCLSVFASCDTETDNLSDVSVSSNVESSDNISESSMTVADDSSESDESENPYISNLPYDYVIPEFDETKVIYNSNTHVSIVSGVLPFGPRTPNFGTPFDKNRILVKSCTHPSLQGYIENNEVPKDAWFPVSIYADTVRLSETESYRFDGLHELLDRIGFVLDDDLNKTIEDPEYEAVGYINMDMLWKIHRDGYSRIVEFVWYPKTCEICGFSAE